MKPDQEGFLSNAQLKLENDRWAKFAPIVDRFGFVSDEMKEYTLRCYITHYVNWGLLQSWRERHEIVKKTVELVESGAITVKPRSIEESGDHRGQENMAAIPRAIMGGGQSVYE